MVSDPAAVLRIAPREHLSRLICRFALRVRPLRIEFDHVSVGLAGEGRFDAPRHLIGRGEQRAIGDMCLARVTPGTEWPSNPAIVSSENPISAATAARLCSTWTEKAAVSPYERA